VSRRELPENPDLDHLRTQAKVLQRAVRAGEPPALALVAELHPGPLPEAFKRADAQLVTARLYGFASWARLREHLGLVARSPVEVALRAGSPEIAELLVAAGAAPAALDAEATLQAALMRGDEATAEPLLHADPELPSRLMAREPDLVLRAAVLGRLDAVRLLATLGFDLNARSRVTALHEAAGHGDLAMVELLLELGADPTIPDTEHHATPVDWARHRDDQAVVVALTRGVA
jgi:Ankyrin repeats (many copies)